VYKARKIPLHQIFAGGIDKKQYKEEESSSKKKKKRRQRCHYFIMKLLFPVGEGNKRRLHSKVDEKKKKEKVSYDFFFVVI